MAQEAINDLCQDKWFHCRLRSSEFSNSILAFVFINYNCSTWKTSPSFKPSVTLKYSWLRSGRNTFGKQRSPSQFFKAAAGAPAPPAFSWNIGVNSQLLHFWSVSITPAITLAAVSMVHLWFLDHFHATPVASDCCPAFWHKTLQLCLLCCASSQVYFSGKWF